MKQDVVHYIICYYSNYFTETESKAWRHWSSATKLEQNPLSDDYPMIGTRKMYYKKGWMTHDSNILKLLENGIDAFEIETATRILNNHKIQFNNCPKCNKLARTPKAKQCRFCNHDWH